MRGKPWSVDEENRLKQMLQAGKSVRIIAKVIGKARDCDRIKIARLNIEVVVHAKISPRTTTSNLTLPEELSSVEEALKKLAASGLKSQISDREFPSSGFCVLRSGSCE